MARVTVKLSASQAAKRTGKSVPTITRAIKSGKLSAEKTPSGGYQIDAAELFRVFKAVTQSANVKGNALEDETPTLGLAPPPGSPPFATEARGPGSSVVGRQGRT